MPLTLDELKLIQVVLKHMSKFERIHVHAVAEARTLINREIKLKETDFIRMLDVNGNPIDNDGN